MPPRIERRVRIADLLDLHIGRWLLTLCEDSDLVIPVNPTVPKVDVQSGDSVIAVSVSVPVVAAVPVTVPSDACARVMLNVPLKTRRNSHTLVGLVVGTIVILTII